MKLRKLHIDEYKMFKNFDISFVDENDKPLPIIVLAGVNGSGKTTLLGALYNPKSTFEILVDINGDIQKASNLSASYGYSRQEKKVLDRAFIEKDFYYKDIIYFNIYGDMEGIKFFLPKHIEKRVYEDKVPPTEVYEQIRGHLNFILKDLSPKIEFDSRDGEGNLFFRNKEFNDKFSIDELSTGEKTLISKILILYVRSIKDKVILIDEPELSLHPSWQNKVLKLYENYALENNCQIIIATHSPHIIGSAKSEYIRLLVKEGDSVKVVDNFHNTYGLKFSQILTEVMGVEYLRPVEVEKQLSKVKSMIVQNEYDSDAFKQEWSELENLLGEDYLELKLLKVEIASRRKDVSSK